MKIAVGTEKGAYVLDEANRSWNVSGPIFPGWKVSAFGTTPDGLHLAAVGSNWFGIGIHISPDFSEWAQIDSPPAWSEESGRKMEQVWSFHRDGDRLWAGVAEAGLFTSDDLGKSWQEVKGLNDHHTRGEWQPGFGGLCAHRIHTAGDTAWVAISAVGVFRSDDGGSTWELKNDGVDPAGLPEDAPRPEVATAFTVWLTTPTSPSASGDRTTRASIEPMTAGTTGSA